jgi:hypothetical protein
MSTKHKHKAGGSQPGDPRDQGDDAVADTVTRLREIIDDPDTTDADREEARGVLKRCLAALDEEEDTPADAATTKAIARAMPVGDSLTMEAEWLQRRALRA